MHQHTRGNRREVGILGLVVGLTSAVLLMPAGTPVEAQGGPGQAAVIPGRYIVLFKEGTSSLKQMLLGRLQQYGILPTHAYGAAVNGFAATIPPSRLALLARDPSVASIEPELEGQLDAQTLSTGINRVDADRSSAAAGDGTGAVDVDIAILDSGISVTHPDLYYYKGKDFSKTGSLNDTFGHGTHVAGIAAARDNGDGVVGVAPGARIWALRVSNGIGAFTTSALIEAIDYMTANAGAIEVANMSLGFYGSSPALEAAIARCVKAGVTIVVSAGNERRSSDTRLPARHPDVICVSAIADSDGHCGGMGPATSYGADDRLASFSNFGSVVDIAAPGVGILSTYKSGRYALGNGTSMAAPHVAGAAALYIARNGRVGPAAVRQALLDAAMPQSQPPMELGTGLGGFSGDVDGYPEPLVYAGTF